MSEGRSPVVLAATAASAGADRRMDRRAAVALSRRTFVAAAVGGAVAGLPALAAAQQGPIESSAVADGLTLVTGAGGNIVLRQRGAALAVVDTGARAAVDDVAAIVAATGARPATVFNTHWHQDQVGNNAWFGQSGARIIAHEKTRLHLATDYYVPDEERYVAAQPEDAWPTESFYASGSHDFEGEQIDYGHLLLAHTDGDAYVWFREANVMAVGDALSPVRDPSLDWFGGGWLGGRADSLGLLLELTDDATRFVPSYGPVVGRDYLAAEHELMVRLYDVVQEHFRQGMGAVDMLAAGILDGLPRTFDDPPAFLYSAYKGMWAHHNTISHDIV